MRQVTATVTDEGQMTIPAEVRRSLGLAAAGRVVFIMDDSGEIRLEPAPPLNPEGLIESLRGAAGSLDRPRSWEEIERIVDEERAAEWLAKQS
jgi:AbrB family looped-hinge helix DNA binding protein